MHLKEAKIKKLKELRRMMQKEMMKRGMPEDALTEDDQEYEEEVSDEMAGHNPFMNDEGEDVEDLLEEEVSDFFKKTPQPSKRKTKVVIMAPKSNRKMAKA